MSKGQPRHHSIIESVCNIGSGAIIAFCVTQFILVPIGLLEVTPHNNVILTCVLTVVSLLRGYVWRRVFNWFHVRGIK